MAASSKVAVIGANGQLGTDLLEVLAPRCEAVPFTRSDFDITDLAGMQAALEGQNWQAIINTAAFHKVELCEAEPEQSFRINALGAFNVAKIAAAAGATAIFISTDYVFSGESSQPYSETDIPAPINVYGVSKSAGEQLTVLANPHPIVLRISSVFGKAGASGKGGNFIEAILKKARAGENLKVVNDQTMSPTYTKDAAQLILGLLQQGASGLFHGSNTGVCTWHDFAQEAVRLCGLGVEVEAISSAAFPSAVRRPAFSALTSNRLNGLGLQPRPWQDALRAYLVEKGHI